MEGQSIYYIRLSKKKKDKQNKISIQQSRQNDHHPIKLPQELLGTDHCDQTHLRAFSQVVIREVFKL